MMAKALKILFRVVEFWGLGRFSVLAGALAGSFILVAGAHAQPAGLDCQRSPLGERWAAPDKGGHDLVGKVLDARSGEVIEWRDLPARLAKEVAASRPLLLLGEVHDNPDHHALRAGLIALASCATQGRTAAVLEHVRADQRGVVDAFLQLPAERRTSSEFFRVLEWSKSGWPDAAMFTPLIDAILASKLAILPGEPARSVVRSLARGEGDALSAVEREKLGLDRPMPQSLLDALAAELKDSHCGALPERAISGLSLAQRFRDAYQADALISAAGKYGGAILLAGNGHIRSDRGVPWYVRQRSPGQHVLTVMFLEVEAGRADPRTYLPRDPDGRPAADILVFTSRAERPDPCEAMRQHMQKKG